MQTRPGAKQVKPPELAVRVAVITGATGGIGRAVARSLAAPDVGLCLTGRNVGRLEELAKEIGARAARILTHAADLSSDDAIRGLVEQVRGELGRIDVLVHCAGALRLGDIEAAHWNHLDELYRVNLRAPFLLTKAFLPMLKESKGEVVFVNSSAGLAAGAENGLYGATKHALHSLAGSIRDHVNAYGIRVISVFPGRTDTPMQEAVLRFEGRLHKAAELLQPSDVAQLIAGALRLPRTAELTDLMVRPMKKPSPRGSHG